jgi:hypothetical protein
MNDRIKQLWSQAGGHYDSGNQHTWPQYTIDNPEKFVELIIKDCYVALFPALRDMISRGQAYDLIKQHFGVKE